MINSPSGSSGWRKEPAARAKKKMLKYTRLTLHPQIHVKSKGLPMSKLDLSFFRIWCWRILLWAINQICFASATLVGIYTCMNRGPDLPPGYSRETSWDCARSPIPTPIFPQKANTAAFISEGRVRYWWWNLPSTASCNSCKNPAGFQSRRIRPPSSESFPYKRLSFKRISIPARAF